MVVLAVIFAMVMASVYGEGYSAVCGKGCCGMGNGNRDGASDKGCRDYVNGENCKVFKVWKRASLVFRPDAHKGVGADGDGCVVVDRGSV